MFGFSKEQIKRYARHIVLPHIEGKGQRKLLDSRVLVVGVGGLGSPVSMYLAAAGVGTLGLVDYDVVDMSNLQRQIVHRQQAVGQPKVDSAAQTLRALNPDITIVPHRLQFKSDNALALVEQYDLVVVCTDDFPSKYLANDACVFLNKPLVWGAVFQFDGQLSAMRPRQSACYRCIFPAPPPPGSTPSCVEAGVLGALVGVVGCWQALEVVKIVTDAGQPLYDRLVIFDGLGSELDVVQIARRADCAVCGQAPSVTELIDYEAFCGARQA